MQKSIGCPKLIIVCGLPGAGKTNHAKSLEEEIGATRFNPDEWMQMLSVNLHDEDWRARVEALQWELAQDLLTQAKPLLSSGGHGAGRSATRCVWEPGH